MNDIHNETWDILFNLSGTNKSKMRKRTKKYPSELSVHSFIPRGAFLTGFGVGFTPGFRVRAGVTPLFVRFSERGDEKCRDREEFGW